MSEEEWDGELGKLVFWFFNFCNFDDVEFKRDKYVIQIEWSLMVLVKFDSQTKLMSNFWMWGLNWCWNYLRTKLMSIIKS